MKFLVHMFYGSSMRPDNDNIRAIQEMPRPQNTKGVQRFLGMINYLVSFIENLSQKNQNLRNLLREDVLWHWSPQHESEFNFLKEAIMKAPFLNYFDPNKELVLSVDASSFALGAAILQEKRPLAYASVSLTECQRNYAQIDR